MSESCIPVQQGNQDTLGQFSPELEPKYGTCVILYIEETEEYVFFRRDDNPNIPYPNQVCPIGGRREHEKGENEEEGIRREFSEEVTYEGTSTPVALPELEHLATIDRVDGRPGAIDMFGCVFKEDFHMTISEGQGLVRMNRDQTLETEFPYGFTEVVRQFAESHAKYVPEPRAIPRLGLVLQSIMTTLPVRS